MPTRPVRVAAALAFFPLLALWTWKLVEPDPFPKTGVALGPWAFLAAKCLHAGCYAVLAGLGMVWSPCPAVRRVVVVGLLLHGAGTEVAQAFVPNRSGRVRDVLIDWAGVGVGVAVVRTFVLHRLNRGPVFPANPAD